MVCESMRDGHVSITVALMALRLVSMPTAWRMIVPGAVAMIGTGQQFCLI